jgi:hypothetical protein
VWGGKPNLIDRREKKIKRRNKMENKDWLGDYTHLLERNANTMFWQHSLMGDMARVLNDKKDRYREHISPKKLRETFELMALMVEVVE